MRPAPVTLGKLLKPAAKAREARGADVLDVTSVRMERTSDASFSRPFGGSILFYLCGVADGKKTSNTYRLGNSLFPQEPSSTGWGRTQTPRLFRV